MTGDAPGGKRARRTTPLATLGAGLLVVLVLGLGIGFGGARLATRGTPATEDARGRGQPSAMQGAARESRRGTAADPGRVIGETQESALPRGRETGWERAAPREPLGASAVVPLKPDAAPGAGSDAGLGAGPGADAALPPPADPGEPKPTLLFQPVATAAGRIEAGGHVVELDGIEVLDAGRQCDAAGGGTWPCGMVARAAFRAWLRGRAVECTVAPAPAARPVVSACRLGRQDAAAWLVKNGLAQAVPGGPYEQAGAEAKAARRGIFGDRPKRVSVTLNDGGGGVLPELPAAPAPVEVPAETVPSGDASAEQAFPPAPAAPPVAAQPAG